MDRLNKTALFFMTQQLTFLTRTCPLVVENSNNVIEVSLTIKLQLQSTFLPQGPPAPPTDQPG